MGDEFHRPTLTFPNGAYNASQVRLYGLPGVGRLLFAGESGAAGGANISVSANLSTGSPEEDERARAQMMQVINDMVPDRQMSDMDKFAHLVKQNITIPIFSGMSFQIALDMRKLGNIFLTAVTTFKEASETGKLLSCGLIVGYAYEGHCYDLPKPKIMLIPVFPQKIPPDDCGYDLKNDKVSTGVDRYMLWIVDKLDECVEFEMNQGFVEQLVLDANMPGKRSPTMYASRMQMAHRSGRLSE
ncbi:hypothetical protein G3545_06720 [Starkeya sp. ORNL1]|uniref:hypothetical protein n=1 Tax=Starkeya sp. ORNL1 TaxID=2709380 RepID=UPI00146286E1|nr:hypothetical protein [Starkeya sp. ORNL1]QJP13375.1 hypothetical protein G3545_06720 [Starkeya sp. ORNL1]